MADLNPTAQQSDDPQVQAIMKGFRAQFPDYTDMADDDVIVKMHQRHYSDLSPQDYMDKLTKKFAPDYKPAPPPLGERVMAAGKAVAGMPSAFVKGVGESIASPVTAVKHLAAGQQLEKVAAGVPQPNIAEMRAKGYTDEQIHNVVRGYTQTQESLMQDVGEEGQAGVRSTGEAAAFYGTLPFGGGGAKAAHTLARSVGTGALFGAAYGAIDEGIVRGSEAAAQGASAEDIFNEVTHGIGHGGVTGAAYGAAGGAVFHGLGAAGNKVGRALGDGLTAIRSKIDPAWAARHAAAEASALGARSVALKTFANKFQPSMLRGRFKPDFDAWQAQAPAGAPIEKLAADIASKLYGQDAMSADPAAIQAITAKIKPWLEAEAKINPAVALPQEPLAPLGTLPPGADLNAQGGLAPEVAPPSVQGPVAQPTAPPFTPPVEPPAPMAGLEQMPTPQQLPLPGPSTGFTPEMQQPIGVAPQAGSPAAAMRSPLDIERLGPNLPAEHAMRLPEAPLPPAGPASVQPPGTASPLDLTLPPRSAEGTGPALGNEITLPTKAVEHVMRTIHESGPTIVKGATVHATPSVDGTHIIIKSIKGAEHGGKASTEALAAIVKSADEAGAPIQVSVTDMPGLKGGKIPAAKIAKWYEKHGFVRTGKEGDTPIVLVRSPQKGSK